MSDHPMESFLQRLAAKNYQSDNRVYLLIEQNNFMFDGFYTDHQLALDYAAYYMNKYPGEEWAIFSMKPEEAEDACFSAFGFRQIPDHLFHATKRRFNGASKCQS